MKGDQEKFNNKKIISMFCGYFDIRLKGVVYLVLIPSEIPNP